MADGREAGDREGRGHLCCARPGVRHGSAPQGVCRV